MPRICGFCRFSIAWQRFLNGKTTIWPRSAITSARAANCYKKALRTYPNNTARLRVEALLDEKGNVLLASTYVPSAWVKSLAECTVLAYASVTFAPGERRLVVIPVHYATQ